MNMNQTIGALGRSPMPPGAGGGPPPGMVMGRGGRILKGSKGIRQLPINCCISPKMVIFKITPAVD